MMTDKQKSILNITLSIAFQVLSMVTMVVVRRLLIRYCGNEANGLYALYASIIGFLSITELGIGAAISYCMYQPIVDGDRETVCGLYRLLHNAYWSIGCIMLAAGFALTPLLPYFAKDYAEISINLHATFLLMLLGTVLTYFYGAQSLLINAYKNNYITSLIRFCGLIVQSLLQIAVLSATHSFCAYLLCTVVSVSLQWILTSYITRKAYSGLLTGCAKLGHAVQSKVVQHVRAMFLHKIGTLLVGSADSLVISALIGVAALGVYSNYAAILTGMAGIIGLTFTSLTSILGHLYAGRDRNTAKLYSDGFHLLNFCIAVIFYLGYYAVIDNLVVLLFSVNLVLDRSIVFALTLNGFVQFLRKSILTFRDATGTFLHDRWKAFLEGMLNIVLSVVLAGRFGISGVLWATVITNLLLCHTVEPYVLYRHAFQQSPKQYYLRNYAMILIFTAALLLLDRLMVNRSGQLLELLINGCLSLSISSVVCLIVLIRNPTICKFVFRQIRGAEP